MDAQEEAGDAAKNTATMDQASNAGKHNCHHFFFSSFFMPSKLVITVVTLKLMFYFQA